MAYVGEPFRSDIFLSYSHGEIGAAGESRLRTWSLGFAEELESEIRSFPGIGSSFVLSRDRNPRPDESALSPMGSIAEQLEAACNAALLVVLVSPKYLTSSWCAAERKWWLDHQARIQIGPDGRIAVVYVWHTTGTLPPEVLDTRGETPLGFRFYDLKRAKLQPQPYEWPVPTPDSRDPFRGCLIELAGRLVGKLNEIREHLDVRRKAQEYARRLANLGGSVVYLHGRADYDDAWRRARGALMGNGLVVFPDGPEPVEQDSRRSQEIRQERVKTMSGCDALLLVGADNGWKADADLVVVGRNERASARALSNRPLPCAFIHSFGSGIATDSRKEAARGLNVEWIDAMRDPWVPSVRAWLAGVGQAEAMS